MPSALRRVRDTFCRHSNDEDVVMSDTATSVVDAPVFPVPLSPSRSVNGSSLGKRRGHQEQLPERASKRIAAKNSSTTNPDSSPEDISTPIISPTRTSIPGTLPSTRPNLSLNPINNTLTNTPEPSSSSSHCPEPPSPAATEIAYDVSYIEQQPEERIETLRAAGIKVRDFAYEPMPNTSKAPEVFDPVPCLIAADWYMRNPRKNLGMLRPKSLFRLIKMGWLSLEDVKRHFEVYEYVALAHYNDKPDEKRYPFVVIPQNQSMPTPSQRVRLRRQAGLATHPDDLPDRVFFGYDPTGYSDDEGEGEGRPPPPPPLHPSTPTPPMPAETASVSEVVEPEAEAVVVEEPKPKRRKAKGTAKTRSRVKPKPLRRECSRPEV